MLKARAGILPKLSSKRDGPYDVVHVHDNGTLTIRRGAVSERVNLRRVIPFEGIA